MSLERDQRPTVAGGPNHADQAVEAFEKACLRGENPRIEDYLDAAAETSVTVLLELVHVDLEHRISSGEEVRVDEYFARFPALAADRPAVLRLIAAEFEIRRRGSESVLLEDYAGRFPDYAQELESLLAFPLPPPRRRSPMRLNCPLCADAIEVVSEMPGGEVRCPSCDETFWLDGEGSDSWDPDRLPQLGKFELLQVVGRGAFGTVYRARDSKLDRIVAVKVPRSGKLNSKLAEDRFVREARSVAQLHHRGIVAVYDVGRSTTFPYIVSEFVEGVTLADALTGRRFSFRETAELVEEIAEALDHAHVHGVVHRDLKPANIMLEKVYLSADKVDTGLDTVGTDDPRLATTISSSSAGARPRLLDVRPRLMDFGLARREEGEITVTLEGQLLGTPAYMSPEQARGEGHGVDGRSDIYSLGVILYELLAGELPFRGNSRMLIHQVLHDDPPPLRRQNDRLPRDLETICLKCLEKEPQGRYRSARSLADDLARYQRGEPVLARRLSRLETAWRWCRRKPALASMGALLTIVVLAALVLVTWQWRRAESESLRAAAGFRSLSDASHQLMDVLEEWVTRMPEEEPARRELLLKSAELYEQFLHDNPADLGAGAEFAKAHDRVAHIRRILGQHEKAAIHFRLAIDWFERLAKDFPGNPKYRYSWAHARCWLGEVHREMGQPEPAEDNYREAIALQRELVRDYPENPKFGGELGRSYYNLGLLYASTKRSEEAETFYRKANLLYESLSSAFLEEPALPQGAARSHINLGVLLRASGKLRAADVEYRQAIDLLNRLRLGYPNEPEYAFEFATASMNWANLLHQHSSELGAGDGLGEAERVYEESIEILRQLAQKYANVPKYQLNLANCHNGLGSAYFAAKRGDDAKRAWEDARTCLEQLIQRVPEANQDPEYHTHLALICGNLAYVTTEEERAEGYLAQAIDHQTTALGVSPDNTQYRDYLIRHRKLLAKRLIARRDYLRAAQQAESLASLGREDWHVWLRAARIGAQCIAAVREDDSLSAIQRSELVDEYVSRALKYLEGAVQHGMPDRKPLQDELFAPLQEDERFQRLKSATPTAE